MADRVPRRALGRCVVTVDLILRPIEYDPARREEEPFDEVAPDTERGFHPGREFPRRLDHAHNLAVLAGTRVLKGI